jgi:hypothetical protein
VHSLVTSETSSRYISMASEKILVKITSVPACNRLGRDHSRLSPFQLLVYTLGFGLYWLAFGGNTDLDGS